MLRDIVLVAVKNLKLRLAHILQKTSLEKCAHCFRHAPDVVVLTKKGNELA